MMNRIIKPSRNISKIFSQTKSFYGKDIFYGVEARKLMLDGVQSLAKAVSVTLGPKGRNVMIQQPYGPPKITKDGVTVAKNIDFSDARMNLGAQLIRKVADKTNDVAGDGTTTATVLTAAIYTEGCKAVAAGMNPMDLKRGIDAAIKSVVASLESQTKVIDSHDEIKQVATISGNGDLEVGSLIAKAMEEVGKEGVITVTDGNTLENQLELVEGMKFDRGYISAHFATNTKTQKCELENPHVVICDKKISEMSDIIPILRLVTNSSGQTKPLIIIAEDIDGDALATLVVNRLRVGAKVCAVKAPGFGDHRKNNLQDLAILTGATLISEDVGLSLEKIEQSWLGTAEKITVTKEDTLILNGGGTKDAIEERCSQLRDSLNEEDISEFDQEKLKDRLAKLGGGVAILKVGGGSEVEVGEKKDRITDALNATRAAVEGGIVAGGGTALCYASKQLKQLISREKNFDKKVGIQIIERAIRKPLTLIAQNAGVEGAVVVKKVLSFQSASRGYDAQNDKFVDMIESGIIDPTKVVKTALLDASSVASLMTTSEAMIVDEPKSDSDAAPSPQYPGMGGGMGGMGGMF